jgi:hypothetical protein
MLSKASNTWAFTRKAHHLTTFTFETLDKRNELGMVRNKISFKVIFQTNSSYPNPTPPRQAKSGSPDEAHSPSSPLHKKKPTET